MRGLIDLLQSPGAARLAYGLGAAAAGMRDPARGAQLVAAGEQQAKRRAFERYMQQQGADPGNPLSWSYDMLAQAARMGVISPQDAVQLGLQAERAKQMAEEVAIARERLGLDKQISFEKLGMEREKLPYLLRLYEAQGRYLDALGTQAMVNVYKRLGEGNVPKDPLKPISQKDFFKLVVDGASDAFMKVLSSQDIKVNRDLYTQIASQIRLIALDMLAQGDYKFNAQDAARLAEDASLEYARRRALKLISEGKADFKYDETSGGLLVNDVWPYGTVKLERSDLPPGMLERLLGTPEPQAAAAAAPRAPAQRAPSYQAEMVPGLLGP